MAVPIIFIHKGDSFYLKYSLENARKFNPKSRIILIGDNVTHYPDFVEYYNMKEFFTSASEFDKQYVHMSTNNIGMEQFCFDRWFVLNEFLSKSNITYCFTLDSDVLLFSDVTKEKNKFKKNDLVLLGKSAGSIAFINNSKVIADFCKFIMGLYTKQAYFSKLKSFWATHKKNGLTGGISDMYALEKFHTKKKWSFGDATQIINNSVYDGSINSSAGFLMENGIKKVLFKSGLPYCAMKAGGKKIKMCSLHFSGPTKFYMKAFANGKFSFFNRLKVTLLMFLRDKFSGLLTDRQRDIIKKLLISFRL